MTDRQKFQNTFSHLHAPPDTLAEVLNMTTEKNVKRSYHSKKLLTAGIAACLVLLLGFTAYATDFLGIQRTLQIWIHGEQTNVTVEFTHEGSYEMQFTDADGITRKRGGGGVAYNPDGSERPLTEEELMELINEPQPEVDYCDDGSVWLYYMNQKIDITDQFVDNFCYVKLSGPDSVLYMTIKYQNGFALSPYKYVSPEDFN